MKKYFLMAAMVVSSLAASAQVYVGGSLNFNTTSYDNDALENTTQFGIKPEIGYNLNEDWAIGIQIGATFTNNKGGVKDANWTNFEVAPYARYTFAKVGDVNFFVDGGFQFTTDKPKEGDAINAWGIGVRPGVQFNVNEKIGVVAKLGYLGYKNYDKSHSTFGLEGATQNMELGMFFNF